MALLTGYWTLRDDGDPQQLQLSRAVVGKPTSPTAKNAGFQERRRRMNEIATRHPKQA